MLSPSDPRRARCHSAPTMCPCGRHLHMPKRYTVTAWFG